MVGFARTHARKHACIYAAEALLLLSVVVELYDIHDSRCLPPLSSAMPSVADFTCQPVYITPPEDVPWPECPRHVVPRYIPCLTILLERRAMCGE